MILRRRKNRNYTVIDNAVFDDERISWAAMGLLAWLRSRPENWTINVDYLRKRSGLGRDKLYGQLNELIEAGWIVKEWHRSKGSFAAIEYVVLDEPREKPPEMDLQSPPDGAAEGRFLPVQETADAEAVVAQSEPETDQILEPFPDQPYPAQPDTAGQDALTSKDSKQVSSTPSKQSPTDGPPPLTPPQGAGNSKVFNRTFLEPDLEAALRAIAAQPLGTPTIEAIEKALRPLGYEVFRFPRLPENDRGRADKISASAVSKTGFSIGFEIDPPRPRHLDKLARYTGRAKVVILRESDLQEPPEVADALLVRKPIEPKPALPAVVAPTSGPQVEAGPKDPGAVWPRLPDRATNSGPLPGAAKGKVFVFEDTPEWRAWMAWWDTPAARERYPRILKPAANTQWPDAPHRGRRGWFFETAWPPSMVGEGPGPLIEGTAVRPLLT